MRSSLPGAPSRRGDRRRHGRRAIPAGEALEGRALLSFLPPVSYTTGHNPGPVAVGDFNGDGRADVAVADTGGQDVGVRLSNPDGTLGPVSNSATLSDPAALAAADVNGDGKPDLIAAGFAPTGSVILNNGNGTFRAGSISAGNGDGHDFNAVLAAPFEGDGKMYLTFAGIGSPNNQLTSSDAGFVETVQGQGDGTFPLITGFTAAGHNPLALATADVNHDGRLDLAEVNQGDNTLGVFVNSPSSGVPLFQLKGNYGTGNSPSSIATGDLNGDGNPDFVVGSNDGRIAVILGRSDGSIQSDRLFNVSGSISSLALADFNGDGKLDLVTANGEGSNTVSVLLGNGDGTFQAPSVLNTGGTGARYVAVGDLNGDGRPDIVASNFLSDTISVLINAGNGPTGQASSSLQIASSSPAHPAGVSPASFMGILPDQSGATMSWLPPSGHHRGPGSAAAT